MTSPSQALLSALCLGAILGVCPGPARAQSLSTYPEGDRPRWLTAWSPLDWDPGFTKHLPTANLLIPGYRTRIGEFWTAGNPGALAREVDSAHTEFAVAWSRQRGEYRRPLDPGGTRLLRLRGESWQSLRPGFSLIGRIVADREEVNPGTASDQTEPYSSSPFITLDTSLAAVRRTRIRLEGASGWRVGAWGLGLTLGLENRDHQTIESGLVRRVRGSLAGAVVGVSRRLGPFDMGVYGRLRYRNETIRLTEAAAQGTVYQLEGFRDVLPINFTQAYYRRTEEVSTAVGASASGPLAGGVVTAYGEVRRLTEGLTNQEQNNPRDDEWRVTGWAAGFSWGRVVGKNWRLEASAALEVLDGKADAAFDSTGVFFTARERRAVGQFGLHFDSKIWEGAAGIGIRHERSDRADLSAAVESQISSTSPLLRVLVGRRLGAVKVSLSGAVLFYGPDSRIPDPVSRGQTYQRFIAPGLDLDALGARPSAILARVDWRASKGTTFWWVGKSERLSPRGAALTSFSPSGSRLTSAMEGGITIGVP